VVSTGTSPAYEQHGVAGRIQSSSSLESLVSNKVVLVVMDNTTVLSYMNRQGGRDLVRLLLQTWGRDPGQAQRWEVECAGRFFVSTGTNSPHSLSSQIFAQICQALSTPQIDLNTKLPCFRVSLPRSPGVGLGLVPAMGRDMGIHLSSYPTHYPGPDQRTAGFY